MEWSAATAEATQAFGLAIEVTQGHEQGVRNHVRFNIGMPGPTFPVTPRNLWGTKISVTAAFLVPRIYINSMQCT